MLYGLVQFFLLDYGINTSVTQYKLPCINGNQSRVLIRDARGVNARSLPMFVTRHHAEHELNHEYLTAARIVHRITALENVMRL